VVTAELVPQVQRRLAAHAAVAGDTAGLRAAVAETLAEDGILLPEASLAALVRSVADELTGLGPLAPLLADPAVTDVLVNGPAEVWVERGGTIERAPVRFPSADAVAALVQRVVAPLGLRIDESRPWVDARLPGGERFHAVLPPLAPDGGNDSLIWPRLGSLSSSEVAPPPIPPTPTLRGYHASGAREKGCRGWSCSRVSAGMPATKGWASVPWPGPTGCIGARSVKR